ncbi:hypothetical protein [Massilia sp. Dwa41.01b]|uniref:formylglycine-generating enzyme family protein n=1 Tax=Massilia sp. Dwa41.01b TaxID=2709302 RepID=UPI002804265B|nr:hypothetical protein [Massilia sp. Dwa41.01b]
MQESDQGAPRDGSAREEGKENGAGRDRRVLRGGAWRSPPRDLRSALRNGFSSTLSSNIVGFRVARELSDAECLPLQLLA